MKYIIQSKCFGDTKWNYRRDEIDQIKAILGITNAKKEDLRLNIRDNSYRIVNKQEKVIFILPDDYQP